jgi:hypothetical protein
VNRLIDKEKLIGVLDRAVESAFRGPVVQSPTTA